MSTLADFTLPRRIRRTLSAAAPIVLTDEVDALGIREEVVDGVELFLRSVPGPVRAAIVAGLYSFEHSARAIPSSLGRGFSELDPEKALAHYERWWHSKLGPLHQLAKAIKMFLAFSYYEHPRVMERLKYDPERWIAKVSQERLDRFADEIAKHEEELLAPDPLETKRVQT